MDLPILLSTLEAAFSPGRQTQRSESVKGSNVQEPLTSFLFSVFQAFQVKFKSIRVNWFFLRIFLWKALVSFSWCSDPLNQL